MAATKIKIVIPDTAPPSTCTIEEIDPEMPPLEDINDNHIQPEETISDPILPETSLSSDELHLHDLDLLSQTLHIQQSVFSLYNDRSITVFPFSFSYTFGNFFLNVVPGIIDFEKFSDVDPHDYKSIPFSSGVYKDDDTNLPAIHHLISISPETPANNVYQLYYDFLASYVSPDNTDEITYYILPMVAPGQTFPLSETITSDNRTHNRRVFKSHVRLQDGDTRSKMVRETYFCFKYDPKKTVQYVQRFLVQTYHKKEKIERDRAVLQFTYARSSEVEN